MKTTWPTVNCQCVAYPENCNWYEIANGLIDAAIERLPEPEIA